MGKLFVDMHHVHVHLCMYFKYERKIIMPKTVGGKS